MESTLEIKGNNHAIEIDHNHIPDWNEEEQETSPSFMYKGYRYYLDEFMTTQNMGSLFGEEYDGYLSETFFSGILVRLGDKDGEFQDECLRAYNYHI